MEIFTWSQVRGFRRQGNYWNSPVKGFAEKFCTDILPCKLIGHNLKISSDHHERQAKIRTHQISDFAKFLPLLQLQDFHCKFPLQLIVFWDYLKTPENPNHWQNITSITRRKLCRSYRRICIKYGKKSDITKWAKLNILARTH